MVRVVTHPHRNRSSVEDLVTTFVEVVRKAKHRVGNVKGKAVSFHGSLGNKILVANPAQIQVAG